MNRSEVLDPAIFEAERLGARNLENVHFIDLSDLLCHEDVCWAIRAGQIIYRDSSHLTAKFTDYLRPALEARLLPYLANLGATN